MTYEEKMSAIQSALKSINDDGYIDIANHGCPDERNELEVIKEALEKQVPKKPTKADWMLERWGYEHECPACFSGVGENAKLNYIQEPYCSQCGQALLWEDTE